MFWVICFLIVFSAVMYGAGYVDGMYCRNKYANKIYRMFMN